MHRDPRQPQRQECKAGNSEGLVLSGFLVKSWFCRLKLTIILDTRKANDRSTAFIQMVICRPLSSVITKLRRY